MNNLEQKDLTKKEKINLEEHLKEDFDSMFEGWDPSLSHSGYIMKWDRLKRKWIIKKNE